MHKEERRNNTKMNNNGTEINRMRKKKKESECVEEIVDVQGCVHGQHEVMMGSTFERLK